MALCASGLQLSDVETGFFRAEPPLARLLPGKRGCGIRMSGTTAPLSKRSIKVVESPEVCVPGLRSVPDGSGLSAPDCSCGIFSIDVGKYGCKAGMKAENLTS